MNKETPEFYPVINEEQQKTINLQSMFQSWNENIERLRQAVDGPQADINAYKQRMAEQAQQGKHPYKGLPPTSA